MLIYRYMLILSWNTDDTDQADDHRFIELKINRLSAQIRSICVICVP